jgi:hypothetical protein
MGLPPFDDGAEKVTHTSVFDRREREVSLGAPGTVAVGVATDGVAEADGVAEVDGVAVTVDDGATTVTGDDAHSHLAKRMTEPPS